MWTLVILCIFAVELEAPQRFSWQTTPIAQYRWQCDPIAAEYSKDLFRYAKRDLPQGTGVTIEVFCELAPGRPA
jgi:hypothetical protein